MGKIELQGKKVVGGKAAGEAVVSHEPISFIGGVDPLTGLVMEKGHELEGVNIAGKVLVYPTGKGSTGGSYRIYEMVYQKTAPVAFVQIEREPVATVGCIMGNIPVVDCLNLDPTQIIVTGDFVEVDADHGTVIVTKKQSE
jgi:predicted aconitase with swiveling domain